MSTPQSFIPSRFSARAAVAAPTGHVQPGTLPKTEFVVESRTCPEILVLGVLPMRFSRHPSRVGALCHRPGIVVMDYRTARLNGLEATRKKRNPFLPSAVHRVSTFS
jgi:hypothetical protein